MKTETQTVQGKHVFTVEETKDLTEKLLTCMTDEDEITAEMKQVAAQYKNRIAGKQLEITSCRTALNNGWEMRPYNCVVVKNFDSGYKEFTDSITGNLIAKEALTAADYQTNMDDQLAQIEKNNKLADGAADQLGLIIEEKVKAADAEPSIFDQAESPEDEVDFFQDDEQGGNPTEEPALDNVIQFKEPGPAAFDQIPREETFSPPAVPEVEKPKRTSKAKDKNTGNPVVPVPPPDVDESAPGLEGSGQDEEDDWWNDDK